MFGTGEMIVVGLIALLLFGNRVPEVMRSVGRGIKEFKSGLSGIDDDIRRLDQPPRAS